MQIIYHGHSCFKLKGKLGTVLMDPYADEIGLTMPKESADIVVISHDHFDHNDLVKISGTAKHPQPLIVNHAGAYEAGGISVFGVQSWHDENEGADRGKNVIFTVFMDGLNVCHLGDLGAVPTPEMVSEIGEVDVLLVPVGGHFTLLTYEKVMETVQLFNPMIFIPMHYKTPLHKEANFGDLKTLEKFLNEYGVAPKPITKLEVEKGRLPEEMELVVLERDI